MLCPPCWMTSQHASGQGPASTSWPWTCSRCFWTSSVPNCGLWVEARTPTPAWLETVVRYSHYAGKVRCDGEIEEIGLFKKWNWCFWSVSKSFMARSWASVVCSRWIHSCSAAERRSRCTSWWTPCWPTTLPTGRTEHLRASTHTSWSREYTQEHPPTLRTRPFWLGGVEGHRACQLYFSAWSHGG